MSEKPTSDDKSNGPRVVRSESGVSVSVRTPSVETMKLIAKSRRELSR